jgi:hypothetical protein
MALLHVKHVALFHLEQVLKLLLRWETRPGAPTFDSLLLDRVFLFPANVGINAQLGNILVNLGFSRTLDYREHYQVVVGAQKARLELDHRARLLSTEGRVFWTEVGASGFLSMEMIQVMTRLSPEFVRILALLFADMLCWSGLKCPTRKCPHCSQKFTTAHFFSCTKFFSQDAGWRTLVGLWAAESWEDAIDYIFHVLTKWATDTSLCRADFRLNVLSYTNLCVDVNRLAFRWNV